MRAKIFCISIALLGTSFVGCSVTEPPRTKSQLARDLTTETNPGFVPSKVNAIAVMPLEIRGDLRVEQPDAAPFTNQLVEAVELETSFDLMNTRNGAKVDEVFGKVRTLPAPLQSRARAMGEKLDVSAILCGQLTKYQASDGSGAGASREAEVAFELWLVDSRNGTVLWSAAYDRTNQPLSENLLRMPDAFRGELRFRDREELLKIGFHQASRELEKLRRPN